MSFNRILSIRNITVVGLICKTALNLGFCKSVTVSELHYFLNVLADVDACCSG